MAPDVPPFDTQQEAARLGDAGFHQQQADAIVGTVRRAVANLVTKEDLDEAVAGLKTSVAADINRQTTALRDELHKAVAESSRQTTALKDELHRQTTALKDEVHKAVTGIHETEIDIHKAIADIHEAINGQTWRYVAFTGTLLAVWAAVLLGLVRLLIPTS